MDEYLRATYYLDIETPAVRDFALQAVGAAQSDVEKAIRLFYAVRDGIRYNPYKFAAGRETFIASNVLVDREAFCVPKAVLLAAVARVVGIPSRLSFADVKNHLSSPRLLEVLKTDIFTFHGSTELFLNGRWVKVTPAFNKSLCEKMKVAPIEFDGEHDAIFQPFDTAGHQFMDYVHDHGSYADLPLEKMAASFMKHYPHLFEGYAPQGGDLESEV